MGMNIYRMNGEHIGKRSAAGVWCWDCKVPLWIKDSTAQFGVRQLDACPKCGAIRGKGGEYNPVMRELGFDKSEECEHHGIDGASSFTWHGKDRNDALKRLGRARKVKTEYGDVWSIAHFWRMFKDVIKEEYLDREFS